MTEQHHPTQQDVGFGHGPNRVTVPLTGEERDLLEQIAAGWAVSVPVAARRLLLLAANVAAI